MSTVGVAAVSRLQSVLPAGVGLLDAPVLGSLSEAEAGALEIFVGGPAPLLRKWSDVLAVLGTIHHVGQMGTGAAAKLVANATLFGLLGLLGEAVALARNLGLSQQAVLEVLAVTPLAAQARRRWTVLDTGEAPVRFALSLARKDADLTAEAAAASGVDIRLIAGARSWLADADDEGWGDRDYSAVLTRIVEGSRR
jgi:3-hydroxyisobutyrate dehydrogenase-like beta-hydroxyacid dehydrogenase